ncbi:MAG: peptidase [Omnitrophica bacterium RIFCSPLOWO2_12_FULL_50_11]|nr:MAG: peptidase [Omnitrophica bacterium RIFCSPLOWO2_12_FULL_50_11]
MEGRRGLEMGQHPFTIILFLLLCLAGTAVGLVSSSAVLAVVVVGAAGCVPLAIRVAQQWQKAVILRWGKFHKLRGPGLFVIFPFIDTIPFWIDVKTVTTPFNAEQTLTKDSVPVDVDAVLFWRVTDAIKAALEVEDYKQAISWASQTALRDVIGKTDLSDMVVGREKIDELLCKIIDQRTEPWGIKVLSVEIRDVKIPVSLQNAMSMQAQAERERQARVILADSERRIAAVFQESSKSYEKNPVALHLRAMNILLEGMKQSSTVIIVPSSAVETMGLGATTGLAALSKEFSKSESSAKEPVSPK